MRSSWLGDYYGRRDVIKKRRKGKLEKLFRTYANQNQGFLDQDQLKKAFEHLGASNPNKQAEEALRVAGTNNTISTDDEYSNLVDYSLNNGFGDSI